MCGFEVTGESQYLRLPVTSTRLNFARIRTAAGRIASILEAEKFFNRTLGIFMPVAFMEKCTPPLAI
jgi:hypothetical protein